MDVAVDGIDDIAVCAPVKLTPEGMKHFEKALTAEVEVKYKDEEHESTFVSDDSEELDEEAWGLLTALAGFASEDNFDRWFEGEDAELI